MNLLEVRQELMLEGWHRLQTIACAQPIGVFQAECEIEIWAKDINMLLIQSFDNHPSVEGASKSFHVFKIAFTSLGHYDSPNKEDTRRMLRTAMGL